ncbi:uncharacterized protein ColSpa_05731 [Colletotrichum spaethianum]|uniref:Uncharacterized protein n=1 Tax=Colletotrichum spaethianum TaxID=700344 RepID=A0AA37LGJ1_9PEZI|nr:uncharacterized protein ColSpa_05731 [Colletotrichum spaethianum]GKT45550.1 hypothetical protein ColSpa_05731 [Colletotrichum spaethianum]
MPINRELRLEVKKKVAELKQWVEETEVGKAWMRHKRKLDQQWWEENFPRMPGIYDHLDAMELSGEEDTESSNHAESADKGGLRAVKQKLVDMERSSNEDSSEDAETAEYDGDQSSSDAQLSDSEQDSDDEEHDAEALLDHADILTDQKDHAAIYDETREEEDDIGIDKVGIICDKEEGS